MTSSSNSETANDTMIDIDLRARELLSDKIHNTEALIIDENHAYLNTEDDYARAAEALGVENDEETVNDALFVEYNVNMEIASRELAAQSIETEKTGGAGNEVIHTWQGADGYYGCVSSVVNGLYSESDDIGPFETREEARDAVLEHIENCAEDAELYAELN